MSLLGIDVGTTGCKSVSFNENGREISRSYREYNILRPEPGAAELDVEDIWSKTRATIAEAAAGASSAGDPVSALAVTSMGEAVVPVDRQGQVTGPSLLSLDARGSEFTKDRNWYPEDLELYSINGNTFGNQYGLTKILWFRRHHRRAFDKTWKFLPWGSFVTYRLGSEPVVDYALANRLLLFDIDRRDWSTELLERAGLEAELFPKPVQAGSDAGPVSPRIADELGLPKETRIIVGTHDQCANAVGSGVIGDGKAMYGLGTFNTVVPVTRGRKDPEAMMALGLNTEHHAVADHFVSFIYNLGGAIVKWYRDTFAAEEHRAAQAEGRDIYPRLFEELPDGPSRTLCIPHFTAMGPPDYIDDSTGLFAGLYLDSSRGEILKGILEGILYAHRLCLDRLPEAGINLRSYTAVGGGSNSDTWVQLAADILGRSIERPAVLEGGALGTAIIAATGSGLYSGFPEGVGSMVHEDRVFEPDLKMTERYQQQFELFKELLETSRSGLQKLYHHHTG
ncbi:MAG: hypothetical protein K9L68_05155 [Spirochaetales bacterium]|nr:hypothetical protein [Spirochaetales bacterium]MCF7937967.1 hypothetical protein [Spirochaetales bacterium]